MKKLMFLACFGLMQAQGQTVKVTSTYELKEADVNHLLDFLDVSLEKFRFESTALVGRAPTVLIKELRKGEVIRTDTLLNGITDAPYLRITKPYYEFSFFTEIRDETLRTYIRSSSYSAGKRKFSLETDRYGYALKDFFGGKKELNYAPGEPIPLLAIITPHDQGNGFASYCEVVQTDIRPEELGEHFGIPHYFLIYIRF